MVSVMLNFMASRGDIHKTIGRKSFVFHCSLSSRLKTACLAITRFPKVQHSFGRLRRTRIYLRAFTGVAKPESA